MFNRERGENSRGRGMRRDDRGRGMGGGGDFAADVHRQRHLQEARQEIPHPSLAPIDTQPCSSQPPDKHNVYTPTHFGSDASSNREIRKQSSDDSLNQKEKILEDIRRRGREHTGFEEKDLMLITKDGQPSTVQQIIQIYHEATERLDLCINNKIFNTSEELQKISRTFTNIYKTLQKQHEACMKDNNNLIIKKSRYIDLTATLSTYCRYMRYIKDPIRRELSTLASQGSSPKISSNDITGYMVKYASEHIEAILFNRDIKTEIKGDIISEIGKSNDKKALQNLVNLLPNKQINWRIRKRIANMIGDLKNLEDSPDLVRILSSKQDGWGIPDSDNISERQEQEVGKSIAIAIKSIGNPEASPYLINLISNEQLNWGVRQVLTITIGSLRHPTASQDLINTLYNKQIDGRIREGIVDTLGELGNPEASPYLINLISDERNHWSIRESAARALGKLKNPEDSPHLVRILSSKPNSWDSWADDFEVGKSIAKTIRDLKNIAVLPALIELRKKQMDARVRDEIRQTRHYLSYLQKQRNSE
jgi:HEAT repeat protein